MKLVVILLALLVSLSAQKSTPNPCGFNEEMKGCGACDSTCEEDRMCTADCREPECGCLDGYKRNATNICILSKDCPEHKCPDFEQWYPCGPCDGTCQNKTPICTMECKVNGACGCIPGYVRGHNAECEPADSC
uniref:Serine protease inhibitor n=1 Tax=Steinernema carpocapsae TaxID=34508 RepID=E2IPQ7_STECR|nr:serine protease inhibitor precursor [Steinernema carpocapsae]ADQ43999.1 serine protease inhibitor precursor [Steinernema carpocapsae]